jgi:hypothetical protein
MDSTQSIQRYHWSVVTQTPPLSNTTTDRSTSDVLSLDTGIRNGGMVQPVLRPRSLYHETLSDNKHFHLTGAQHWLGQECPLAFTWAQRSQIGALCIYRVALQ